MLQALQLECTRGFRTLFRGLDVLLNDGELLHLRGANGSGKTSLLRILCGLLAPTRGEVRWRGESIRDLAEDFRREIVYIGHASGVKDELTAAENLRVACALSGARANAAAIGAALDAFGVARYANVLVKTFSQGQRRRVALARLALSAAQPLWLLDEPFNALDAHAAGEVEQALAAHLAGGGMVVMTAHQPLQALAPRARVLELPQGAVR
jgi:heme exporter protein A